MRTHNITKQFLLYLLPVSILLAASAGSFYVSEIDKRKSILEAQEALMIDLGKVAVTRDLRAVVTDLMVVARHAEFDDLFDPTDPTGLDILAREFLVFSQRKFLYDQVRFLDETGMEIVRIDFNVGQPAIVPKNQLQDKSDRYYFIDTIRLDEDEVYISPYMSRLMSRRFY